MYLCVRLEIVTADVDDYEIEGHWIGVNLIEFVKHASFADQETWKIHEKYLMNDQGSTCAVFEVKESLEAFANYILKPGNGNDNAMLHGITLKNEMNTNDLRHFHLSFGSLQFYFPKQEDETEEFVLVTLNKFVPGDHVYFYGGEWKLEFNESVSRWQLYKQNGVNYIFDSFRDILPMQSHEDRMQKLAHNQIDNVTVNAINLTFSDEHNEWNGEYKLYGMDSDTCTERKSFYDELYLGMKDQTVYLREKSGVSS